MSKLDNKRMFEKAVEAKLYATSIKELTGYNKDVFIEVFQKYMRQPNDRNVRETFVDNVKIAGNSIVALSYCNRLPTANELLDLDEIRDSLGRFLDTYGYENEVAKIVRKAYLQFHNYFKNLLKSAKSTELRSREGDMDFQYLKHYHKYLDENIRRVQKGLNPKTKPEDWEIDACCDLGEVQLLALEDSVRSLRSGIDYSHSRRDLNYYFGNVTMGEYADSKLLSGASQVLDEIADRRAEKIKVMENVEDKDLEASDWLMEAIRTRINERR